MTNRINHRIVLLMSSYGARPGAEKSHTAYDFRKGEMDVRFRCRRQRAQNKPRADESERLCRGQPEVKGMTGVQYDICEQAVIISCSISSELWQLGYCRKQALVKKHLHYEITIKVPFKEIMEVEKTVMERCH